MRVAKLMPRDGRVEGMRDPVHSWQADVMGISKRRISSVVEGVGRTRASIIPWNRDKVGVYELILLRFELLGGGLSGR